jgi:glycerol-3-phosphate acyltransferase PlsY
MERHINLILVSLIIILLPLVAAGNALVPAMILFAFMLIIIPVYFGINIMTIITFFVLLTLLALTVMIARKRQVFMLNESVELKKWRIIARPFALLFIPIEIYLGPRFLLYLLGILSIVFILIDLYRLIFRQKLLLLFKRTEVRRFSSMTSFIVAIFIVFLLFPGKVAYLCLAFITIGDMAGKFIGLKYGAKKLIQARTLEGSLGFLTGCIFAGYILVVIFGIDFAYLIIGAVCATLFELFSFRMDDNFTVSILTGSCLVALQYFQVI